MTNKVKDAFSGIRAEATLKDQTKQFILEQTTSPKWTRRPQNRSVMLKVAVALVLMLTVGGGFAAYFTPVAAISIDAEHSIELQLNRFDRVVDYEQYGETNTSPNAELMHATYSEAVADILGNPNMHPTSKETPVEITITSKKSTKVNKMMQAIDNQTHHHGQTVEFFTASFEEHQQAHQQGMSLGKHRMYQLLLKENPDIQLEEIREVSMHDLHQMMGDGMGQGQMYQPKHQPKMKHHDKH